MNARDAVQGVGPSAGISKRKLRANRVNEPAGTGPTSAAGKARAARNARKHGLNVPVHYDPNLCAHVEAIAAEIVPGCRDTELLGLRTASPRRRSISSGSRAHAATSSPPRWPIRITDPSTISGGRPRRTARAASDRRRAWKN